MFKFPQYDNENDNLKGSMYAALRLGLYASHLDTLDFILNSCNRKLNWRMAIWLEI